MGGPEGSRGRPTGDFPRLGLVADHAYWLSGLQLRGGGQGTVDAVSYGLGAGDPPASGIRNGGGVQTGGALLPILPYLETYQTWGAAPQRSAADRLDLTVTGVSAVTIDLRRARLDSRALAGIGAAWLGRRRRARRHTPAA